MNPQPFLRFVVSSLVLQFLAVFCAGAQPTNDNFASRGGITLAAPTVPGSNIGATKEPGEPTPLGKVGGHSVWWSWVSPANGPVKINTIGSSFDTLLGVYTGSAVSALTVIAEDDDSGGSSTSLVSFAAQANKEYLIEVDGYNGVVGSILVTVDALPAITGPVSANGTLGLPLSIPLTVHNAPTDFKALNMPTGLSIDPASGVISGVPEASGPFNVSLSATNAFGTATANLALSIDTAPAITSASFVAGLINAPFSFQPSALNNPTSWGAVGLPPGLSIDRPTGAISGSPTANGIFSVTLYATNATAFRSAPLSIDIRPANDDFAAAVDMGSSSQVTGSNAGATRESGEPVFTSGEDAESVWWKWTSPATGTVELDTVGSPFDTILGVFTGSSVGALTLVGANDDSGGNSDSLLTFSASAGTTYSFCVNGYHAGQAGPIILTLRAIPPITSALTAVGTLGLPFNYTITAGNNPGAYGAGGLPSGLVINTATGAISGIPGAVGFFPVVLYATNGFGAGSNTLNLTIDSAPVITNASLVYGQINVPFAFTPGALNNPTSWGAAGLPSNLAINPSTGVISGTPNVNGVFSVTLFATNATANRSASLTIDIRPSNDDFEQAATIVAGHIVGSNAGATRQPGEPNFISSADASSVWWNWTAPGAGVIQVDTIGTPFDSILGVFTGQFVTNLALVASDDDNGGNHDSLLTFTAVQGVTYHICVNGFHAGEAGLVQLNITSIPFITSATNATGTLNLPFSYTITAINAPISFGATGLPAGLSINPSTGVISGSPQAPGGFPVALYATNSLSVGTTNLALTINQLPVIYSSLSATGQVGVAFSYPIAAVNSPSIYVALGLPANLSVNPSTGLISGVPQTNGFFNVTLITTNAFGSNTNTLSLMIRPVNDDFAAAIPIGASFQAFGNNLGATREAGEPLFVSSADVQSIWWKWTSQASGVIRANTIGSPFDTILGVFAGPDLADLTVVGTDDDSGGNHDSQVQFTASAGVLYYFCVNGFNNGQGGNIVLNVDALPRFISTNYVLTTAGAPFNFTLLATNNPTRYAAAGLPAALSLDSFSGVISGSTSAFGTNAVAIFATNVFGVASNVLTIAAAPPPAPAITSPVSASAQVSQPFNYTITALNFPISFGASGLPLGLSVNQASGVISGSPQTNGSFLATVYATNASGFASSPLVIAVRPANDDFAGAFALPIAGSVTGSTLGATAETGEPVHAGSIARHSVWYTWTSPTNGALELSTYQNSFDTVLAVYIGGSLATVSQVASNDDVGSSTNSLLIFNASAGVVYHIAVDGFGGDQGSFHLGMAVFPTLTVINTAPTLAPIRNDTNDPGALVTFTNAATDGDLPPQSFTYSLDAPFPSGAAVDPATGVFTWRPGFSQAQSTNTVIVRVTDSGNPPLSDARSFVVVVNPLAAATLAPLGRQGSQFQFSLTGNVNINYALQSSTTLLPGSWSTLLTTNLKANPTSLTDTNATNVLKFYRAKATQ